MRFFVVALSFALLLCAARPLALAATGGLSLDPAALAAVERFESVWRAARSTSYRIIKTERLRDGKVVVEELAVKYQKPGRVYVKMLRPIKGREIIYDRTKNRKKLTVHNGRFPDLTLHLDVQGMLATQDQHHTIEDLGFDQAVHVFRSALESAKREPHGEHLEYVGVSKFDGHTVDHVIMHTGKRPARRVAAEDDESLLEFARRVDMDAYVIYGANPSIRSLTSELDAGEVYTVPAYYAERCDSWFDRITGMPLKQVMWDRNGKVYESYEHFDLRLDVRLTDADFSERNQAYGF